MKIRLTPQVTTRESNRPIVEPANDGAFEQDAEHARRERAYQDGQRQRHAGAGHRRGDIGAAGDELPVRHIDDPHHSEDDGQPASREYQEGEHVRHLVRKGERLKGDRGHRSSTGRTYLLGR